ncbi:MAG: hypothetical protein IJO03_08925 [Clostridia bacterium]|nr:hypothetical protein [Clostridia bacterium]MBQ7122367.1 hypothetical protein [Clostridia bacterium]
MKNKVKKMLTAFPFCFPFAFSFFAVNYYLSKEWSWLSIAAAVLLGVLSFVYAVVGKESEMLMSSKVGILISFIIICFLWNSVDKLSFWENYGMTFRHYFELMELISLGIPLFAAIVVKIIKKIKNKTKKQNF